jgi:hypothetical protein
MRKTKRRLLLIFSGSMSQPKLDRLRAALELSRMGRLTDLEDEHFGTRQLRDDPEGAAMLNLWRTSPDAWSITIDATPECDITEAGLGEWERQITAAAESVELGLVERRSFQTRQDLESRTEWSNENWLRTTGWDLPAQTLEELWAVLDLGPARTVIDRRAALEKFMGSPAWEAAPNRVKTEAESFLRESGDQNRL